MPDILIFAKKIQYELLSSPQFVTTFLSDENKIMNKVVQYLTQNFQNKIRVIDLRLLTCLLHLFVAYLNLLTGLFLKTTCEHRDCYLFLFVNL